MVVGNKVKTVKLVIVYFFFERILSGEYKYFIFPKMKILYLCWTGSITFYFEAKLTQIS